MNLVYHITDLCEALHKEWIPTSLVKHDINPEQFIEFINKKNTTKNFLSTLSILNITLCRWCWWNMSKYGIKVEQIQTGDGLAYTIWKSE